MKIIIKETSKVETLSIIDSQYGIDYIYDFIGSTSAFIDGQFDWSEDSDAFVCDQKTFDWWNKVVTDNQSLNERIKNLSEEHCSDAVQRIIESAGSVDLEDHAANVNQALDEYFVAKRP